MAIIITKDGKDAEKIEKSDLEKEGHLQSYIHENPDSIPAYEIKEDKKLFVVAREFSTESGPIDALAIDKDGDLYVVETKLYKNPEKRTVVAQALDYGASLWRHSDYNEFISKINGEINNKFKISFEEKTKDFFNIDEEQISILLEAIKRNLQRGNIKFVILMDAIDDRLKDLIVYINQNSQFDIYAVQMEYYKFEKYEIMIPKLFGVEVKKDVGGGRTGRGRKEFEPWWGPVLNMKFDDPEQPTPYWAAPNNIVLETPCLGVVIKACKDGIFLSKGKKGTWEEVDRFIASEGKELKRELPVRVLAGTKDDDYLYLWNKDDTGSDEQKYDWLKKNLNAYVNVLWPRLKKWREKASV